MSSGSNPTDPRMLLAMSIDQPYAHTCCCCGHHAGHADEPFGRGLPGHSGAAEKVRAAFRRDLTAQAKILLATAQRALLEGATTAGEIRDMQRLEIWLARLIAEEGCESSTPPPPPPPPRPKR